MAYRLTMSQEALDFWHALLAPFQDHELSEVPRGGRTLTYIDKRALENRLDTVCGPQGWWNEFQATDRGMICTIHILVPIDERDSCYGDTYKWTWCSKSDGGGAEGMVKKAGVEDEDNDFKSEFTNAFRRAAQDAWGIGRYLYKKGMPGWLDPQNMPLTPGPANVTKEITGRMRDVPVVTARPDSAPVHTPPENLAKPVADPAPTQVQPLQLPRPGGGVWRWAKEMELKFKTSLISGMQEHAKTLGIGTTFNQWDEPQVRTICLGAVGYCMNQKCYGGEFDHLAAEINAAKNAVKNLAPPPGQGVNVADIRRELAAKMKALIHFQTGREADNRELTQMLQEIAPQCPTERATAGEVPESLAKMADVVWIRNIMRFVDDQIAHVQSNINDGELAEIPF